MADYIDSAISYVQSTGHNLSAAVLRLSLRDAIRLIMVIGAYTLLLRPFLTKFAEKRQADEHAKATDPNSKRLTAAISPNALRGQIDAVLKDSDEDDAKEEELTGGQWGKKARRRQRQMIREAIDAEGKRVEEVDSDEEMADLLDEGFLEKYMAKEDEVE